MELYNLGKVSWDQSQLIYHALAKLGRESLCLVSPSTPYVCLGYHQNAFLEVDLEFCRMQGIPIFRRQVGGGSVYLDGNQLFFQIILHRNNPLVPKGISAFYKKYLQPVIEVHHRIGIPVSYKPVNDLVIENRKISGTGAGEIGDCIAFVGNLILDFDYAMMSKVLNIPDEKFRDKVRKTIQENLTTIRRELGEQDYQQWDELTLNRLMIEEFEKILGPLIPTLPQNDLIDKMKELRRTMITDDWLFYTGKQVSGRVIKIRSGLEVRQRMIKAQGGLLRADFNTENGKLTEVSISGDFFCFPLETVSDLEKTIEGTETKNLRSVLAQFYEKNDFELPGVEIDDWEHLFIN